MTLFTLASSPAGLVFRVSLLVFSLVLGGERDANFFRSFNQSHRLVDASILHETASLSVPERASSSLDTAPRRGRRGWARSRELCGREENVKEKSERAPKGGSAPQRDQTAPAPRLPSPSFLPRRQNFLRSSALLFEPPQREHIFCSLGPLVLGTRVFTEPFVAPVVSPSSSPLLLLLRSHSSLFRIIEKNIKNEKKTPKQRVALAFHGFALIRELWCALTVRGTFSRIRCAAWGFARDPRGGFVLPPTGVEAAAATAPYASSPSSSRPLRRVPGVPDDSWHVTERDLHAFRAAVESPDSLKSWGEPMLVKDFGTLTYKAWRRSLPDGKTEYKSVTVALDSTAEEFSDFFLDDNARGGVRTGDDQGSGWVSSKEIFPLFFLFS